MNRITAAGLVGVASGGKRVLAVTWRHSDARTAFEETVIGLRADEVVVRRALGRESITFASGGELRFVPYERGGVRGLTADLVFVDHEVAEDPRAFEDCVPCASASPSGEVIRA